MASNVGGIGGIFQELISPTKTPKPYDAPYVNPQESQMRTAKGNLAALPTLEQIASGVDTFNIQQRNKALTSQIPGYTNLVAEESGTLGSWLRGEIPQDVVGQVNRSSAARALGGGYGGSGMQDALTARDLGLTSLDLQGRGMSLLPGYLNTVAGLAVPAPFNVASGFLTPGQGIAAEQFNEQERATQQWLKNRLDALPDPLMAAVGEAVGENLNQDLGAARSFFSGGIGSSQEGGSAGGGGGGNNFTSAYGSIFGSGGGGAGMGGGDFGASVWDPNNLGGYQMNWGMGGGGGGGMAGL